MTLSILSLPRWSIVLPITLHFLSLSLLHRFLVTLPHPLYLSISLPPFLPLPPSPSIPPLCPLPSTLFPPLSPSPPSPSLPLSGEVGHFLVSIAFEEDMKGLFTGDSTVVRRAPLAPEEPMSMERLSVHISRFQSVCRY